MNSSTSPQRAFEDLVFEVRQLFHALAREADRLHSDLDVTAAERGILETLSREDAMTVPAIARSKGVSRQHIQALIKQLQEAGHVAPVENPSHRRSPLFRLTDSGRSTFAEMRATEGERVREIAWNLHVSELVVATRLLRSVRAELGGAA